jgi:YHS domain-containing protein
MLRRLIGLIAVAVTVAATSADAPKPAINKGNDSVAIKGYDTVAYIVSRRAIVGSPKFEYSWSDATWRFASQANRERFMRDPKRYAPQFGGYCAWAISRGYTADVDPEAFQVVDGRVYLIYSKSVQMRWEQDIPGNITKAEANWPAVLGK